MCNLDNKVQIGENGNEPAIQEHIRVSDSTNTIETFANQEYKWGFVTDIEADAIPRGLSEDVVRLISAKKNEPAWLLEWRLKAYRHWLTLKEPTWANIHYPEIDYQNIIYYSSPKPTGDGPKSLDDVAPARARTSRRATAPRAGTMSIRKCPRPTPSSASPRRSRPSSPASVLSSSGSTSS